MCDLGTGWLSVSVRHCCYKRLDFVLGVWGLACVGKLASVCLCDLKQLVD
jgi:hypothetical protein